VSQPAGLSPTQLPDRNSVTVTSQTQKLQSLCLCRDQCTHTRNSQRLKERYLQAYDAKIYKNKKYYIKNPRSYTSVPKANYYK
jgi:hypothetical protein